MQYSFIIPGKPIAKKRPRFARRGKFVVTYDDQETEEGRFMMFLANQWGKSLPISKDRALEITYVFVLPIPKTATKKALRAGAIKRPDLSNYVKFAEDCMLGVILEDDSCIVKSNEEKIYGDKPETRIYIDEIERDLYT
jgi:Holliday junction resolvase RusA-like endonuclease